MVVGLVLHPLLVELRSANREKLCNLLDLSASDLEDCLAGDRQFSIPELMAIARWMRRPISTVLAPLDRFLGKCA